MFFYGLCMIFCSLHFYQAAVASNYVGCYQDSYPTDLSELIWDRNITTVDKCVSVCSCKGFKYAGLQRGYQCYCGDSYGRHGNADENECSMTCNGNPSQICGGFHKNSVYSVLVGSDLLRVKGQLIISASDCSQRADASTGHPYTSLPSTLSSVDVLGHSVTAEEFTTFLMEYLSVTEEPSSAATQTSTDTGAALEDSVPTLTVPLDSLPQATLAITGSERGTQQLSETGAVGIAIAAVLLLLACAVTSVVILVRKRRFCLRRNTGYNQTSYESFDTASGKSDQLRGKEKGIQFENPLYLIDTKNQNVTV